HGRRELAEAATSQMSRPGVYPPADGYWDGIQSLCRAHDVLLIADEVITGLAGWEPPSAVTASASSLTSYAPPRESRPAMRRWASCLLGRRRRPVQWNPKKGINGTPPALPQNGSVERFRTSLTLPKCPSVEQAHLRARTTSSPGTVEAEDSIGVTPSPVVGVPAMAQEKKLQSAQWCPKK